MPDNRRVLIVDDQRAIHDDFRKLLEAAPASAALALEQTILGERPLASVDYVSVADATTLAELDQIDGAALLSMAVRFGNTRLIDNEPLTD